MKRVATRLGREYDRSDMSSKCCAAWVGATVFGQVSLSIIDHVADYINIYPRLELAAVIRHNASSVD